MNTKITSTNQSGGITGQNVNVNGPVQTIAHPPPATAPSSGWRRVVAWSVGGVGLVASILGILDYLGIKLWG